MSNVTIIIPTLNEADNIDPLLERIFAVKRKVGLDFEVLFVDSASRDGTCQRVAKWQKKESVKLLSHGYNVGLAGAVLSGAQFSKSDYILVMDADLSHPPEIIPQLLEPLIAGSHDMVIGSRYVEGGAIPDWPLSRKLSSKLYNCGRISQTAVTLYKNLCFVRGKFPNVSLVAVGLLKAGLSSLSGI